MKRTCENCSRPLLDTDTVCWHCGQKQPLPAQPESPPDQIGKDLAIEEDPDPEPDPVPPALIFYYGGLTAVIIVAVMLTVRSLGQRPIVTLNLDSPQGDWVTLTSPGKSFTIDIPANWDWQFQEGKRTNSSSEDLLEHDSGVVAAVTPLGNFVTDFEYLFAAEGDSNMLVVARSERLNRLSPQQAVTSLQEESFDNITVKEARLVQATEGEEKAFFKLEHLDIPLQCDQYFVPGSEETYVVSACSLAESNNQQQEEFNKALSSFNVRSR